MRHFIVVGAGIAGLNAARHLQRAGCAVTVFEAARAPGGRILSVPFHGRTIECGAQFVSSRYRYVLPLLQEAGLSSRLRKTSAVAALQREQDFHAVHSKRPWTLATAGQLTWSETWQMLRGGFASARDARGIDPSHYASLAALDEADAQDWAARVFGGAATRYVFEPMVHGLYFHRLKGTSRALLAALSAFRGADTLTVEGGWQALPRAMAASLDVRYGANVEQVAETLDGVRLCVNGEWVSADGAVLATPAHATRAWLPRPTLGEAAVLDATYAPSIHVALGLSPSWSAPKVFAQAYGALFSPVEGGPLAALTFQPGAGRGDGPIVCAMFGEQAAMRAMPQSNDMLIRLAIEAMAAHLPGVERAVVSAHAQRWAAAEPRSPVGRARAIAAYRATLGRDRRIVLAGDYLGSPWTDGAAESGHWAAGHLLAVRLPRAERATLARTVA
ncbi:protoporphyrinogen/coproporphyrinogen oxidase [Ralstonia mojiangensis]|uniref:protoporphyrinogen/coproporphyrinogen oxidase n=1 Tax=Ralstonia mojiangensis TaxID=2953895 RepID=UPI0021B1D37C|nr:NAD(P)/FAD-dependent oxidoreductase [Ralstonia mojiangensis]MCT7326151.1 FAD-dependent oxidoreductase [Ralstonia mojiangensis]